MLKALIFDVDGTLADTEGAHRDAFNAAFRTAGLGWHWSEVLYADRLEVSGGKERIGHYWQLSDPGAAAAPRAVATIDALHALKTRHYFRLAGSGRLALHPGILRLIKDAGAAHLPMGIATTTTSSNTNTLLRTSLGSGWRAQVRAVYDAGTTSAKKPAPDVYHAELAALALPAEHGVAFEDSANGLLAAPAAGIPTLVTPTAYTRGHCFDGALLCLDHLGNPDYRIDQPFPGATKRWVDLAALRRWHAGIHLEVH